MDCFTFSGGDAFVSITSLCSSNHTELMKGEISLRNQANLSQSELTNEHKIPSDLCFGGGTNSVYNGVSSHNLMPKSFAGNTKYGYCINIREKLEPGKQVQNQ